MLEPPVTPIRKANDGLELPATGFGTYKVNGLAGVDAIKSAIHQGYRLIDSAFNYENEGVVGRAIRESGVPREDIIVTSKLPGRHHAHDEALLTIEESVCRMGLDYIDLYLIHWPNPSQGQFVEAWEALVEARERGLVKHIAPVKLSTDGLVLRTVNRHYALPDGSFTAMASGAALASGIPLNDQFLGTGYHKDLRLWGDFGSQLYLVEQLGENEEDNTK